MDNGVVSGKEVGGGGTTKHLVGEYLLYESSFATWADRKNNNNKQKLNIISYWFFSIQESKWGGHRDRQCFIWVGW